MGFGITKKKNAIPELTNREADGAEVWVVSWNSLLSNSGYGNPTLVSCKRRAKAFLSKDDADDFVSSLKMAMEFLQNTYYIDINIEKQL